MAKVSKRITVFPTPYKSVVLEVSDADSFNECNKILIKELDKYIEHIPEDDIRILNDILGVKICLKKKIN